ncbi:MAG: PIN domain-containing protein [Bacteroidota bacterium]
MTSDAPVPRTSAYLLDTGPIIAVLDRGDQWHAWARTAVSALDAPVLTCEPVVTEAWFLARRGGGDPARVLDLLAALDVQVVPAWRPRTDALLRRYADRVSVADASLLALAEEADGRVVVTTDRDDFAVYRIHRRRMVPALVPSVRP